MQNSAGLSTAEWVTTPTVPSALWQAAHTPYTQLCHQAAHSAQCKSTNLTSYTRRTFTAVCYNYCNLHVHEMSEVSGPTCSPI